MSRAMMVEAVSAPETGEMAFRHGYEGRDVEALLGRSKGDLFADTYSEIYRFAVEPFLFDALTSAEPKIQTFSTESDAGRLLIFSQLALPVGEGGGQSNAAFVVFDLARMHQAGQILSLSLHTPLRRMLTEQRRPGRLGTIQI